MYLKNSGPPSLPRGPIPELPPKDTCTGKVDHKNVIGELPLQLLPLNRRIDDLDDDDYSYTTSGALYSQQKKKDIDFEDVHVFMDAHQFVPCKDTHSLMISRFFFSPQGIYKALIVCLF